MRPLPLVWLFWVASLLVAAEAQGALYEFFSNDGRYGVPVAAPKLLNNGQLGLVNASLQLYNATDFLLHVNYFAVTGSYKGPLSVLIVGKYGLEGLGQATTIEFSVGPTGCSEANNQPVQLCALSPPLPSYLAGYWQFYAQPAPDNTTYGIAIGNEQTAFLGLPYVAEFICATPGTCPQIQAPVSIINSLNNQTGNVSEKSYSNCWCKNLSREGYITLAVCILECE